MAVIFFTIDEDFKLNVLLPARDALDGIRSSAITGAVSPLTECAPIGDRSCPIGIGTGQVLSNDAPTQNWLYLVSEAVGKQLNDKWGKVPN